MHKDENLIVLLVGPKGTGKSYLGKALQDLFGIPFLRIEGLWLTLRSERTDFGSPEFQKEGTRRCIEAIKNALSETRMVVIETTGALDDFSEYLAALRDLAKVHLVNVQSSAKSCLERVRTRDQSLHIPVSDDRVDKINARSLALEMKWDLVLINEPFLSTAKIKTAFKPILG